MPVTLVMLEAIRDYYYETGIQVGMKPAGGISKSKLALHYLVMLNEVLGVHWMNNQWFRFGASSLANDVFDAVGERGDGAYQSGGSFRMIKYLFKKFHKFHLFHRSTPISLEPLCTTTECPYGTNGTYGTY